MIGCKSYYDGMLFIFMNVSADRDGFADQIQSPLERGKWRERRKVGKRRGEDWRSMREWEERIRLKKYERGEGRGGVRGDEEYGRVKFSPSINWQNLTCCLWILASGVTLRLYKIIHTHLFSLWSRKILTLEGRRHHRTSDVGSQTLDGVVPFGEVSQYERFYVPGILQCCFSHLGLNLTSSVECINRSDKLVLHRDLWSNSQSLAVTFHYNCHCY